MGNGSWVVSGRASDHNCSCAPKSNQSQDPLRRKPNQGFSQGMEILNLKLSLWMSLLQKHEKRPLGDISVSKMSYQRIMFGMKPDCKTLKIKFTVVHIDTPQKYGTLLPFLRTLKHWVGYFTIMYCHWLLYILYGRIWEVWFSWTVSILINMLEKLRHKMFGPRWCNQ